MCTVHPMHVVGLTGTLGAGKGVVVDYLVQECGYAHYSVRGLLASIISERGDTHTPDRPNLSAKQTFNLFGDSRFGEACAPC